MGSLSRSLIIVFRFVGKDEKTNGLKSVNVKLWDVTRRSFVPAVIQQANHTRTSKMDAEV